MTVLQAFEKAYGPLPEGAHLTEQEIDADDYPGQANSGLYISVAGLGKHGFKEHQKVMVLIVPYVESLPPLPTEKQDRSHIASQLKSE